MQCKKCGSIEVNKDGKKDGVQTYRCKICKHRFKDAIDKDVKISNVLQRIQDNYTDKELKAIANGGRIIPGQDKIPIVDFSGNKYRFCHFTDTHMGSIFFKEEMFNSMLKESKKMKVDAFYLSGDVTEGMSNRPDHVYSLAKIGYTAQRDYAIDMLKQIKKPLYMVSGNHDRWFIKSNGANIVGDIADNIKNAEFIGHDTGIVNVNGCNIQPWHGEDGNSYATSYRIQKVVESLVGGSKPNVMLFGHTHKHLYMFERNIHCLSGGSIELQTDWMRSKRLIAHTGFTIAEITINKDGNVTSFWHKWYPFYA
jgi:predicted phosphodiesterase